MNHSTPGSAGNASSLARPTGPPAAPVRTQPPTAVAERGDPGVGQVEHAVGVGQHDEVVLGAVTRPTGCGHGPPSVRRARSWRSGPGRATRCDGRDGTTSAVCGRTVAWRAPSRRPPQRGRPAARQSQPVQRWPRPAGASECLDAVRLVPAAPGRAGRGSRPASPSASIRANAAADPLVELASRWSTPSRAPRSQRGRLLARRRAGNGAPGQRDDIQGRHDPLAVAGQHRGAAAGVVLQRVGVQHGGPDDCEPWPPASACSSAVSGAGDSSPSTTACM